MDFTRTVAFLLPLLALSSVSFAQATPPAPIPVASPKPAGELYEDEAWNIATARVPGKKIESEFQPVGGPVWIFHDLDLRGRECVVTVAQKTRAVSKIVVPKLTVKQALAIALKKVRGKRSERRKDLSTFDPKRLEHTFYIDTPKKAQAIQVVTVSDKTGKVVGVTDMGDAG